MPRIKVSRKEYVAENAIAAGIAVACAIGGPLGIVAGLAAGALFGSLLDGSLRQEAAHRKPGWDFGAIDTDAQEAIRRQLRQAEASAEFDRQLAARTKGPAK